MTSTNAPDDDRDQVPSAGDASESPSKRADAWINARLDRLLTSPSAHGGADTRATTSGTARLDAEPVAADVASNGAEPRNADDDRLSLDVNERRRVADLQLLDALLASRQTSRQQAVERALDAAFKRLDTHDANAAPESVDAVRRSAEIPDSRRPKFRMRRRFMAWCGAVATVALLAVVGWRYDKSRSAYAMVTRWEQQAVVATDRTYRVTIEPAMPLAARREATFYVRGGRQFVFDDPGPLSVRLLFGSDGKRRWRIASGGPAYLPDSWQRADVSHDTTEPSRYGAPPPDAPYLRLDALLSRLRERYELRAEGRVASSDHERVLDHVSARLAESASGLKGIWPSTVEVWAAPDTGVVRRLELRWPTGSLPIGPRSLVFELDSERPLGDRFFEAESHWESPK